MSVWQELRTYGAYVRALRGYLRTTISREEAMRRVGAGVEQREEAFVGLLGRGVFDHPRSPYRRLFQHAGIDRTDAVRLVREDGLEAALHRFHDAGVRLTIDELRGQVPIVRDGLELATSAADFDNPLAAAHFQTQSGGSRSGGTAVNVDLGMNEHAAGYSALFHEAYALWDRPLAIWFPTAPATTGLRMLLTFAKVGIRAERWFSQSPLIRGGSAKQAALTETTVALSKLLRNPLPLPEHTPPDRAGKIARWLFESKERGRPAVLTAPSGSAVRVCVAAQELGLDISGSFFRLGAEPYTAGRAESIAAAGCRAGINYYMAELGGFIGVGCGAPAELDEVHLLLDKLAVVQRDKQVGETASVGVLAYTTLHPLCPKLLINFESDDYGVLDERHCGCPVGSAGFSQHLHGIRSYEKLTSEGITFAGSDVITLVEEVFPRRFGGSATDYQLVEEEGGGVSRVAILIDPRVRGVDDTEVIQTAISFLRSRGRSQAMMAEIWRNSGALHVIRREPYVTAGAKIPVVHTLTKPRG